jgi:cytochrome P450
MLFLDEFEALAARLGGDVEKIGKQAIGLLEKHTEQHPEMLFAFLRETKPIFVAHGFAVVTRFEDVQEILNHPNEFTVALYLPKMEAISVPFFLGFDNTPQYEHDVSVMRLAMNRGDLPRIASFVAQTANQLVADAESVGKIDMVSGLTDLVPTRLVADYFGTPGPDEATQLRWTRILFNETFLNLKDDPAITAQAVEASAEMRSYLDGVIASRKAEIADGVEGPDDVVGRLIRMQPNAQTSLNDTSLRNNLFGVIVGAIPTTSKATALALNELLSRPDVLIDAQQAAKNGDEQLVAAYISEAMRFAPQNPGLLRKCAVDYTVAKGTLRETTIPAGTITFVATQSAMLDDHVIDEPEDFRVDRPPYHYMHFGSGMHTCFGQYINRIQIPLIGKALLQQKNLRRVAGSAGELVQDGPFPTSLTVEFDPV